MGYAYGWRGMSAGHTRKEAIVEKDKWKRRYPRRKFRLKKVAQGYIVQMYGKMTASETRSKWASDIVKPRKK